MKEIGEKSSQIGGKESSINIPENELKNSKIIQNPKLSRSVSFGEVKELNSNLRPLRNEFQNQGYCYWGMYD